MAGKLIIDGCLPSWDVEIAEHRLVHADPETTWRAARVLPDRIAGRQVPVPPKLAFGGEGGGLPGWAKIATALTTVPHGAGATLLSFVTRAYVRDIAAAERASTVDG